VAAVLVSHLDEREADADVVGDVGADQDVASRTSLDRNMKSLFLEVDARRPYLDRARTRNSHFAEGFL
jgi:hypothetical protein